MAGTAESAVQRWAENKPLIDPHSFSFVADHRFRWHMGRPSSESAPLGPGRERGGIVGSRCVESQSEHIVGNKLKKGESTFFNSHGTHTKNAPNKLYVSGVHSNSADIRQLGDSRHKGYR